ncbi:hypothetical protein [Flavobacterium sp.]|uniref:hypothetical protein n=1 Tax=Flavobacterium sp. TaxID=239 RepID=UPI003D6BBDBA
MKTIRFLTFTTFIFLLSICFSSCFIGRNVVKKRARVAYTEENNAIPPEFGKKETVLLCVLKGRNSYDKYLRKAVIENYKGEYLFITPYDLIGEKYPREKYRYYFDYNMGKTSTVFYQNSGLSSSITYKAFFVRDRLTNESFENGASFSYFREAMIVYMQNLEFKRLSIQ